MAVTTKAKIHVTVHYPAAARPFQGEFDRATTVGALKTVVLDAFGLVEGATGDGNTVTYELYHEKDRLDNLSQTLGDLAEQQHALQLKLAQVITQGSRR